MIASLNTRARLLATIGLMAGLLALVGLIGYRTARNTSNTLETIYVQNFEAAMNMSKLMLRQMDNLQYISTAVLSRTPDAAREAKEHVQGNRELIKDLWAKYSATVQGSEEKTLADDFATKRENVVKATNEVMTALEAGKFDEAVAAYASKRAPLNAVASTAGEALIDEQVRQAQEAKTAAASSFATSIAWMAFATLAGIVAALTIGWLLARSMVNVLHQAVVIADDIAHGRLGHRFGDALRRKDEFGDLLRSLERMDRQLVDIVGRVHNSSGAVADAARELAKGNDDLAARSQSQASALEETAASMEEMTSSVKQTAQNSELANRLAQDARSRADQGGTVVGQAVDAMGEITRASHKISDIIGVIDEIAFQTNLLALNAAVEAARAGEQGRGFAVVASEVRSLAQRSATAAREIKTLIQESVQRVATGSGLVQASGTTLDEIMLAVKKLTDIVGEISTACREQAAGIEQVNMAVTQMDQNTQQNAALVEESSAASMAMDEQARQLIAAVGYFKVGGAADAHLPVSTGRAAPVSDGGADYDYAARAA